MKNLSNEPLERIISQYLYMVCIKVRSTVSSPRGAEAVVRLDLLLASIRVRRSTYMHRPHYLSQQRLFSVCCEAQCVEHAYVAADRGKPPYSKAPCLLCLCVLRYNIHTAMPSPYILRRDPISTCKGFRCERWHDQEKASKCRLKIACLKVGPPLCVRLDLVYDRNFN